MTLVLIQVITPHSKRRNYSAKKTPLANNFYVDTTLTKDITTFENKVRQRDEQLKKIRQEQQRQEPLIRPQQYGIGAIDTPTATTLDALALLKIERELKK